jgi:hypothetical protein
MQKHTHTHSAKCFFPPFTPCARQGAACTPETTQELKGGETHHGRGDHFANLLAPRLELRVRLFGDALALAVVVAQNLFRV